MTVSDHKIKEYMEEQFDIIRQQQSSNHSDNLVQLKEMNSRLSENNNRLTKLETSFSNLSFGAKVGLWILAALGAFVTWFVNVFGVHIGFKP